MFLKFGLEILFLFISHFLASERNKKKYNVASDLASRFYYLFCYRLASWTLMFGHRPFWKLRTVSQETVFCSVCKSTVLLCLCLFLPDLFPNWREKCQQIEILRYFKYSFKRKKNYKIEFFEKVYSSNKSLFNNKRSIRTKKYRNNLRWTSNGSSKILLLFQWMKMWKRRTRGNWAAIIQAKIRDASVPFNFSLFWGDCAFLS